MKGVVMNQSKIVLLTGQLAAFPLGTGNSYMGLLQGVATIAESDSDGTVLAFESVFGGYARQNVGAWTTPTLALGVARSNAALVTFMNSSGVPQTIDGWFFIDTATPALLMAGLYDVPIVIPAGDTFPTRPFWTQQSHFTVSP